MVVPITQAVAAAAIAMAAFSDGLRSSDTLASTSNANPRPRNSIATGARDVHPWAVDLHRPDEAAYGRVTNPERYQVVHDAARLLIDQLTARYEVEATPGESAVDFPRFKGRAVDVVRLRPTEGAPVTVMFTDFPGVLVGVGVYCLRAFPMCGCDACDEQPEEVAEALGQLVSAAIAGRFREELTKRGPMWTFDGDWGSSTDEHFLEPGGWKRYGAPGSHSGRPGRRADPLFRRSPTVSVLAGLYVGE